MKKIFFQAKKIKVRLDPNECFQWSMIMMYDDWMMFEFDGYLIFDLKEKEKNNKMKFYTTTTTLIQKNIRLVVVFYQKNIVERRSQL